MKAWLRVEQLTDIGSACLVTVSPGDLQVEIDDEEARRLIAGRCNVVFGSSQSASTAVRWSWLEIDGVAIDVVAVTPRPGGFLVAVDEDGG